MVVLDTRYRKDEQIMKQSRIIRSALALLAAITTVAILCVAQEGNAQSDKERMLEERRLVEQAVAKAGKLRLQAHPVGTGEMLQQLAFADIKAMHVYKVNSDGTKGQWH